MRKIISLFLLLLAADVVAAEPPVVLILGDSLSAGYGMDVDQSWPALLQVKLQDTGYEHQVVNASITGETSEGAAGRIDTALSEFSPSLVVLELGGNDGLRGFPAQRLKSNLVSIIEKSQAAGAGVVLLGIRIPSNYGPRYTASFEQVYRDLASEYALPWIDFFMEGVALDDTLMQDDGIHPNASAQPRLLDNAWPVIAQALDAQTAVNADRHSAM